eukprot:m.286514 g.286514  ORF g.286514 m.286514 type:complete len:403 (-) comp11588_c0_seq1:211-1419(-)
MLEPETEAAAAVAETKQVDLTGDDRLKVNIADALNEQDIVKFTVHTKTTLDRFAKREFQVTRQHEEFVWLHDCFVDNEANAGYIIPPCPPKPDFSQSHGKLAKLQAGDPSMPQEELDRLKQEIQGEYLAAFQKTVAMHEVFLMRLASHPVLQNDQNLQVFLEYDKDLRTRSRTKTEKMTSFFKNMAKAVDTSFSSFKDPDEQFESQKHFLMHYNAVIKLTKEKAEEKVKRRRQLVQSIDKTSLYVTHLAHAHSSYPRLSDVLRKVGDGLTKVYQIEKKLAAKEDLKMTDLLRYYVADGNAAKDLMHRRIKAYQEMEKDKKNLDKARTTGKKVSECQDKQDASQKRYESITETAREELATFKKRRVTAFRKGLIQYTQCQIRQSKEQYLLWKELHSSLREMCE